MPKKQLHGLQLRIVLALLIFASPGKLGGEESSAIGGYHESVALFNGHNFDGWYVYTPQTKYDNPGVFQVVNGTIYVPGGQGDVGYFGGLITKQSYCTGSTER